MAKQWSDFTAEQQQARIDKFGSKKAWEAEKRPRMAGDKLNQGAQKYSSAQQASRDQAQQTLSAGATAGSTWKDTAKSNHAEAAKVQNLDNFDLRSFGAGGSQSGAHQSSGEIGAGKAKFNISDARQLLRAGNFTAQELMDYGNSLEGEDKVFSSGTQSFLQKKIDAMMQTAKAPASEGGATQIAGGQPGGEVSHNTGSALQPPPPRTTPKPPGSTNIPDPFAGSVGDTTPSSGYEFGEQDPAVKDYYLNYMHSPGNYQEEATSTIDHWVDKFDNSDKVAALDHRVNQSQLYWKYRGDEQTGNYLGDIWSYEPPKFEMPDPLKAVEAPDLSGQAEETMDRIEKIKPKL